MIWSSPLYHGSISGSFKNALDCSVGMLRQRRALREFGENPERAHTRDATTVERYEQ